MQCNPYPGVMLTSYNSYTREKNANFQALYYTRYVISMEYQILIIYEGIAIHFHYVAKRTLIVENEKGENELLQRTLIRVANGTKTTISRHHSLKIIGLYDRDNRSPSQPVCSKQGIIANVCPGELIMTFDTDIAVCSKWADEPCQYYWKNSSPFTHTFQKVS